MAWWQILLFLPGGVAALFGAGAFWATVSDGFRDRFDMAIAGCIFASGVIGIAGAAMIERAT